MSNRIIPHTASIRDALRILNDFSILGNTLFITDNLERLIGTLSDGDIRRGLLNDLDVNSLAYLAANKNFHYIKRGFDEDKKISDFKKKGIRFIPLVNKEMKLINILDLNQVSHLLPVSVVIMAGGKGQRLLPLTEKIPKPLLKIGKKPLLEHNIDRLIMFGIEEIAISVNYLSNQIIEYFKDGSNKNIKIDYIEEKNPLGTFGSITLKNDYKNENILLMNSDLLTNINYEDFYSDFIETNADLSVASVPYHVDIPYAVLETEGKNDVKSLQEKPRFTYYSNAGIYIFKKSLLKLVQSNSFLDTTDFIELLISKGFKVNTYPILGYWLDIGRMSDYLKAQEDIKHLHF